MSVTPPELLGLASELADSVAVAVPRGWTQVNLSLDLRGGQVRVTNIDAKLSGAPAPSPELGMDVASRIGGLSAALTDALHLLHRQGIDWNAARATLSRPGPGQLVLTLINSDGRPASSVSVPREYLDALFVSDALLEELHGAGPALSRMEEETATRLSGLQTWNYSQPDRRASFIFPDRPKLEVPAQILGTWTRDDETWLWAWANSSVEPGCTDLVEQALQPDARAPGAAVFWREKYPCEEGFAHKVAQLAAHRMGAKGVFRGRAGDAILYLALMA
jgi:hypothetical protein